MCYLRPKKQYQEKVKKKKKKKCVDKREAVLEERGKGRDRNKTWERK
jgi:hypothetical protein